jgi:NAD(P)-dependent dehydrogenase (short-subunit alcohol dehydrogenase family)
VLDDNPAYGASKGGLKTLTKCCARDLGKYNIRANNVGFGYIRTAMTKQSFSDIEKRQAIANQAAATRNQQEMYNKGLLQQQFQNQMAKATGVSGAQTSMADNLQKQAAAAQQAQQAQTGAMLKLAGTVGGAAIGGPAGAAAGGALAQTASSGYGGDTAANPYDDYYMNKLK